MPEDTAVLEMPDTAEAPVEAPPFTAPETAIDETTPETDGLSDTPETDEGADPLAELDDESIASNERVQGLIQKQLADALARERESARRTAEYQQNQRVKAEQVNQAKQAADGLAAQELLTAIRADIGDDEWTWGKNSSATFPKALEKYGSYYRNQYQQAFEQAPATYLTDGLKEAIPADLAQYIAESRSDPNPAQLPYAWAYTIGELARKKGYAEGLAAAEAERAEKDKTDAAKGSTAARKAAAPRPAGGANGGAPPIRNPRDIITDPNASMAQKRAAYKEAHGFDPPF